VTEVGASISTAFVPLAWSAPRASDRYAAPAPVEALLAVKFAQASESQA